VSQLKSSLTEICERVLREKENLLHSHEELWCRAFTHLLRRFLVPYEQVSAETLRRWLEESLIEFPKEAKVTIHVSERDCDSFSLILGPSANEPWRFVKDSMLKAGEVACECEAGGLIFSPGAEIDRLDAWIDTFKNRAA